MQAPNCALLWTVALSLVVAQAACSKAKKAPEPEPTPPSAPSADQPPPATPPAGTPAPAAFVDPLDTPAALPPERTDWWYAKAARALTGRELSALPDADKLRALPQRQFVEALMALKPFGDQMLQFNLEFLGFLNGPIKTANGQLADIIFTVPAAAASARALMTGGDYLSLFDAKQPLFVETWGRAQPPFDTSPGEDPNAPEPSQDEIRAQLRLRIDAQLKAMLDAAADPALPREQFCAPFFPTDGSSGLSDLLDNYGMPYRLAEKVTRTWSEGLALYCFFAGSVRPDAAAMLVNQGSTVAAALALAGTYDSPAYAPKSVVDLDTYDLAAMGLPDEDAFTDDFFRSVTNSSTNFDRRRGAYVLKRFFCDDLTPINQAIPASHAEGRHASDPGCVSCHYKLDPMAGYFKDRGVSGFDFSNASRIIFDDLAEADHDTYVQAWRAPEGEAHAWDIGYVRSLDNPALNSYGETLGDLFQLIKTAPEPKTCLVRRLFSHFNGDGQALDPAWLEELAQRFTADAATDGSAALRRTVSRIVLGKTFAEPDPISAQCYDRVATAGDGGPPCQVSSVLQKYCASCHGAGGAGGLDLTHWVKLADGTAGFAHTSGGTAVSRGDTMQQIEDRLASGDNDQRMPLGRFMPAADRETIYLWAQKEASR
jgi:hypothetical protein